jgi:pimeloyl-ACP methyl ester carboxylesterase
MLAEMKIPTMVIRASKSDMFEAETLAKVTSLNPRLRGIELAGSHDLAGDNPEGLAAAVSNFLAGNKL